MNRRDLEKMRNQNQDKRSRQVDVYMFAASFSILDSIIYVSDVQKVCDVTVNNKWFVKERAGFEEQFTDYVRTDTEQSLYTSLYFSEKAKKVSKQRQGLIKRNNKKNHFYLQEVSGFAFSNSFSDFSDN